VSVLEDDSTSDTPRLLIDQPGPQNLVVVDWAVLSVQGRQRLRNEDAWAQGGPVFAVADGMGGLANGNQASAVAVNAVLRYWTVRDVPSAEKVVRAANAEVRAAAGGASGEVPASGTTLSALRIGNDKALAVHVGDSRVYRVRRSQAELLTRDHNLRSELLATGIVPKSVQSLGPLRALTSYLGMPDQDLQIDVRSVGLRPGDRILLCTDGVFGEISHRQLAELAGVGDAALAAQSLIAVAGADDATAMVVDIGRGDAPRSSRG